MTTPAGVGDAEDDLLCILTLDGGGIRGLSSLLILRELMDRISIRAGEFVRPCDYFNLIVGTGTGGISALLLGRMRMSVDQAIDAYIHIAETVFKPKTVWLTWVRRRHALLDGAVLEKIVGEIAERILDDPDAPFAISPHDPSQCRTAVLASTGDSADAPPYIFRSYSDGIRPASAFPIRAVARATASTAGLFAPFALGSPPIQFMDAGVGGYNNPTDIGFSEAKRLWPGREPDCFVSLGTGLQKIVAAGHNTLKMANACRAIVENCEKVHDQVLRRLPVGFPYFRFNANRGLDDVDVMEWKERGPNGKLTGVTDAYMRWAEVVNHLNACVQAVLGENGERSGFTNTSATSNISTHGMQDSRKFHHILPPPPEIFHGRHDEVERATALIQRERSSRIAILGAGGIGKTSIALAILHDARIQDKFKDDRIFVACEVISSLPSLVDTICAAFDMQNKTSDRRNDLLLLLEDAYSSRPLILVLDNFETIWDLEGGQHEAEEFLCALGAVASLSLVLTMRGAEKPVGLRWSTTLDIGALDADAALSTFVDVRGTDYTDDAQLDELLRAVDFVPLAVTLLARLGQTESPAELLNRWSSEQTRLLSRPRIKHRLHSVDASIDMSIRSHRMQSNPDALALLSAVAMLPSGVFHGDLPQICPRISNLAEASATLREVSLAYHDASHNLRVLSPIRLHTLKNYPASPELLKDVQSFHFGLAKQGYVWFGEDSYEEAVKTLPRHGPNIEAVISQALREILETRSDEHADAVDAALKWTKFLTIKTPRKTVIELAVQVVRKQQRRRGLARCLRSLGDVQRKMGDYEAARESLTEARDAFEAVNDHHRVAACLRSLGAVQRMMGDYDSAQETIIQAQERFGSVHDEQGVAACLQSLGNVQCMMGNYDVAQGTLIQARVCCEAVDDWQGVAFCLRSLGEVQHLVGDYDAACETLIQAQEVFEAVDDRRGVSSCLWSLGEAQSKTGDYDAAQETFLHARDCCEAVHDWQGVAFCLWSLGELQRQTNDYDAARETLAQAREVFEVLKDRPGVASCLRSLGDVQRKMGQYDIAQETLIQARDCFQAVNYRRGVAYSLESLGDVQRIMGNYEAARETLIQARDIFEAVHDRAGVADCLYSLERLQSNTVESDHTHQSRSRREALGVLVPGAPKPFFADYSVGEHHL